MTMDRRNFLAVSAAAGLALGVGGVAPAYALTNADLLVPQTLPDMSMGKEDAPVTIVEYASVICPHCAHFHETTLPALKEKYIDTGKVRLIFREFPYENRAAAGFMLARCAPQDKYFPLIDVLFKQQRNWATAPDPRPPLLQIAKLAGFTQESFEACLKNQELLDKVIGVYEKATKDYGVDSTPTFFINGEKAAGALSIDEISKIIDKYL